MTHDVERFIGTALEASVYVRPRDPGLTESEIRAVASAAGFLPGEVGDALKATTTRMRQRRGDRLLPNWNGLSADFHSTEEPDYRDHRAFEFVRQQLLLLSKQLGRERAHLDRNTLIRDATHAGLTPESVDIAIAVLVGKDILREEGPLVQHTVRNESYAMPSSQVANQVGAIRKRPDLRAAHDKLSEILRSTSDKSLSDSDGTPSPVVRQGSQGQDQVMSSIRVFISHSHADAKLAEALVHCLEASMVVPNGSIRCTSVSGYKLSPGDVSDDVLRHNLERCSVVVGLLTPESAKSGYVIMELGAAWGLRKSTCAVLAGVGFDKLPGPLRARHAVDATKAPDIADLTEHVGRSVQWEMKRGGGAMAAVTALVAVAQAIADQAQKSSGRDNE